MPAIKFAHGVPKRLVKCHRAEKAIEVRCWTPWVGDNRRSEINQLYVEIGVHNAIFVFDIPMTYTASIEVINRFDNLCEHPTRAIFRKVGMLFNAFKEIA